MYRKLKKIVGNCIILKNELLSKHTSFKIGGKCKYFVEVDNAFILTKLVLYLQSINYKYYVLGGGTNVLANSKGFDGVIISTTKLDEIREYNDYVQVFCGTKLATLCNYYKSHNIGGLEDASGIPGTIGGAVVGNAGAYDFTMSDCILGVLVIEEGKVKYLFKDECNFEYRNSGLRKCIVLSVDIKKIGECNKDRINEVLSMRAKNRIAYPNAGSIFKRRGEVVVSKLLDELGLKGKRVGGASVSEVHAGFIVNDNNATSSDIKNLICEIKNIVKEKTDLDIVEEIQYIE